MPVADLLPAPYNGRHIDAAAMAGLSKSIQRFDNVELIAWNRRSGYVVGGHQRLKVLRGKKAKTTELVVVDLDAKVERALNVALNSPHIAGEFTADLQRLFGELLAEVASEEQTIDADAIPDLPTVTLIACERQRRVGYACEISAAYCDIIVERWQRLTGKKVTHA